MKASPAEKEASLEDVVGVTSGQASDKTLTREEVLGIVERESKERRHRRKTG